MPSHTCWPWCHQPVQSQCYGTSHGPWPTRAETGAPALRKSSEVDVAHPLLPPAPPGQRGSLGHPLSPVLPQRGLQQVHQPRDGRRGPAQSGPALVQLRTQCLNPLSPH